MPDRFRRSVPWDVRDLLALYATTFAGVLLVFLAWYEVSASTRLASQVRWTNVGVAGVIVLGAGNLFWLLRGRRAAGQLKRRLLPLVAVPEEGPATVAAVRLVAGSAMTRFHRSDCPLVAGKSVKAVSEAAHRRAGRQPCGVCEP